MKRSPWFFLLTAVFFGLSVWAVSFHELTLDEARPWIIMKSVGWSGIIHETRCEMHCLPWFYAVKGLTTISVDPVSVKLFSALLGTLTFALIVFLLPFGIFEKILLLPNYYLLFEYNILGRPYVLMSAGIILAGLTFSRRKERPWPFLASILFLENTTYFGIFLTFPFISVYGWEFLAGKIPQSMRERRKLGSALAVFFVTGVWYALPLSSSYNCFDLTTSDVPVTVARFSESLWDVVRAFFPMATATWNEHLFDNLWIPKKILMGFWVGFILGNLWLLRKSREALWVLASGVFIIFAYRFCKPIYFGSFLRHLGVLSIVYIVAVAMAWTKSGSIWLRGCLLLFLGVSAFSGIRMYAEDVSRPFSNGPAVAAFLDRPENRNARIIPDSLLFSSPYLVYSDRPYFDYISGGFARYFALSADRVHVPIQAASVGGIHIVPKVPDEMFRKGIEDALRENGFVITNYIPRDNLLKSERLVLIREFTGAVDSLENYYIYGRVENR